MSYETLLFEVKEKTAYITMNRPESANGLIMTSGKELMHAAICCDEDPEIRAVLLTGNGKFFSAGGDLKYFCESGGGLAKALKEMTVYCHAAASRLVRMNKPLVTAVNGAAAGMGMSFALCGDLVIAAESATFTAAYTGVSLAPDGGMTYLLPRYVGLLRAKELLLTNRRLTAKEALDWGLVNRVVPDAELRNESEKMIMTLAAGPTHSYGSVKRLLSETFSQTLETQLEYESRAIVDMSKTNDAQEGIDAFLTRRKPVFKGM
jgi:2-(1,2-epoxy-1,2-dihydrophenyl)acetyl-CoA isomerase